MAKAPFIGGFNEIDGELQSASETTINLMPEKIDGKAQWRLTSTPGLRDFVTLPLTGVGCRGAWEAANRAFFVVGNTFYEIFENGTFTRWGFLTTDNGPVSIDDNGLQLLIVDGANGYAFTLATNVFATVVDVDFFPTPVTTVIDGFAIGIRPNTQQFFHSELNNVALYDPLDIISAEGNPDRLVSLGRTTSGLLLWGTRSLDLYVNVGGLTLFQRAQGSGSGFGAVSAFSVAKLGDEEWTWVGRDENGQGGVYSLVGLAAKKISNIAVDTLLQSRRANLASARAFVYRQNGHEFYILNIPAMATTLVYDRTTQMWHERRSMTGGVTGRWRAECHVSAFGLSFVGDALTGNIYVVDPDTKLDAGNPIFRSRTLTPLYDDQNYSEVTYSALTIDCLVGVGDTAGSDPQLMLEISNDGGVTFGNAKLRPIGKLGKYSTKVQYRRLGRSRNRVFRLSYGFPTEFAINNVFLDASL